MGLIGGLLGLGGGASGTGFSAPQGTSIKPAELTSGVTGKQIGDQYAGVTNGLQQQRDLLYALQNQGGINNQSQVYGQLQGVANGTGPNPAQAMLNQATGQNVANQAALMAGQRGANANVGLLARQAGMAGAGIQQNAVGQAANMQANQSLNALGAAGNLASNQVANQVAATGSNTNAQLNEQQLLQGALNNQNQSEIANQGNLNNANVAMQGNINTANSGLAQQGMQNQQKTLGGIGGAIGTVLGLAGGGQVPDGSHFGKFYGTMGGVGTGLKSGGPVPGQAVVPGNSQKNDTVPALLSPGEVVIPRSVMQSSNPQEGAARFIAALMAKKRAGVA